MTRFPIISLPHFQLGALLVFCVKICFLHGYLCFLKSSSSTHSYNFSLKLANQDPVKKEDNKAMKFLRKIGRITDKKDFTNAIGVDEGVAGGKSFTDSSGSLRKSSTAFIECTKNGIIDSLNEKFPFTSSGNQWFGVTDTFLNPSHSVSSKVTTGSLTREEDYYGKTANVLRGRISKRSEEDDLFFIQMSTNLAINQSSFSTVDASSYNGIEIDLFYNGSNEKETFHISLRTPACRAQTSCYKASFEILRGIWTKVKIPWKEFLGYGPGPSKTLFDHRALRRISLLAQGEKSDFELAFTSLGFY